MTDSDGYVSGITQNILEHISTITSVRDMELLSCSLLKSIISIIKPADVCLVKFDNKRKPIEKIICTSQDCVYQHQDIEIDSVMDEAIQVIFDVDKSAYKHQCDGSVMTLFKINEGGSDHTLLIIETAAHLSDKDSYLIDGMLGIYGNFYKLLIESQTDTLTGLPNRETFDRAISRIHELSVPKSDDVVSVEHRVNDHLAESVTHWIAILDIDFFKKINDTHGHLFGDEVLVTLAQILRSSFRGSDLLFRFGGEEFVAIIRSPDKETTFNVFERLRKTVEDTVFPGNIKATISVGYVKMASNVFYKTLLDYADQALYHSKKTGRNKLTFFDDLIASGEASIENITPGDVDLF